MVFGSSDFRRWQPDLNGTPAFQRYVNKYTEVVLADPWADIVLYYDQAAKLAGAPVSTLHRFPFLAALKPIIATNLMTSL